MESETDYVLGTHDEEMARLGLQHRAWQGMTHAAWRAAGIGKGQAVLDLGCGPGYASLDLAQLVGPSGRVIAVDKSEKFLNALAATCAQHKIANITTFQADLDAGEFPDVTVDGAWCRWVFAFLSKPRQTLASLGTAIRPGGSVVIHEYFDYSTWRSAPRCVELEDFVAAVMKCWRDAQGEPDIALSLVGWLEETRFEIQSVRPILHIVHPGQPKWGWLRAFVEVGRQRLVDLGYLTAEQAEAIQRAFQAMEGTRGIRMFTPAVLELIAVKKR